MLPGFLLSFREGLEAALIIGILMGALDRLNQQSKKRIVWAGAISAVILSVGVGIGMNQLGASFEGRSEEIFEGIAMLVAAGMLTWVVFWMQNQSRSFSKKLESDVQNAVGEKNGFALFALSFLSVFREGVELALFLTAAAIKSEDIQILLGTLLGLISVIILSVLLFKGLIRLDVSKFFRVSSIILVVFAAGLVAHGVHELNEAGWIPGIIDHLWDINHIIDEGSTLGEFLKTLLGYNGNPSLTEVLGYLLYSVSLLGLLWKKPIRSKSI